MSKIQEALTELRADPLLKRFDWRQYPTVPDSIEGALGNVRIMTGPTAGAYYAFISWKDDSSITDCVGHNGHSYLWAVRNTVDRLRKCTPLQVMMLKQFDSEG